jgi:regulation of enolase protein 1 (concanavalin A-like superfamily)
MSQQTDPGIVLSALPEPLHWQRAPVRHETDGAASLTITAAGNTDLFADPRGGPPVRSSPCALMPLEGDYLLSARVTAGLAATFDAGALILHAAADRWAKLALERSPQGEAIVVTVITQGKSDDCNSIAVEGDSVWFRIARNGQAFAFHCSLDGQWWSFVRHFTLGDCEPQVGFSAQSPTGEGCTARFDDITLRRERLADLRDGS